MRCCHAAIPGRCPTRSALPAARLPKEATSPVSGSLWLRQPKKSDYSLRLRLWHEQCEPGEVLQMRLQRRCARLIAIQLFPQDLHELRTVTGTIEQRY